MKKHILVTGCPRSGTGYMAHVMSWSGMQTSHEWFIGPGDWKQPSDVGINLCSWMMNEQRFLALSRRHNYVVHLVRNPLDCISSILAIGLVKDYQTDAYSQFIKDDAVWSCDKETDRAAMFWVLHNMTVAQNANYTMQVEKVRAYDIYEIAGECQQECKYAEKALAMMPNNYNHKVPVNKITLSDMSDDTAEIVLKMGREFGYDL